MSETPHEQITRVAKRFARTRDLGEVGGWFDKECQKFDNPLGVAWFTSQVMLLLNAQSEELAAAFVLDLDAI